MVHKKYIKRGKKVFGPYIYENYRENGITKTRYLGKAEEEKKTGSRLERSLFILFGVMFLLCLFILPYAFFERGLTGRATLEVAPSYSLGEKISGNLNLILKKGELIPADSVLKISLGNETKEISLSELISLEQKEGSFYAENIKLEGNGKGYGFIGVKKIYPEIDFELLVLEEEEKPEKEEEISENITEEAEEQPEEPEEEVTEQPVEAEEKSTPSQEQIEQPVEIGEEQAPITGEAIRENKISVTVSAEKSVTLQLEEGQKAKIVEGSVKINGKKVDESLISLKIEENQITITTDYEEIEKGFGLDYVSEETETINIDLEQFDLTAESGQLVISLEYNDVKILDVNKQIIVESKEEVEEVNITEDEEEIVTNITEVNITEANITIPENITEVNITEANITIPENITEVNVTEINITTNITIIENITEVNITEINITTNITILNVSENLTILTTQYQAKINEQVKWKKNVKLDKEGAVKVELPNLAENISVYVIKGGEEKVEENKTIEEEAEKVKVAEKEEKVKENITEERQKEIEEKPEEIKEEIGKQEIEEAKPCSDSDKGLDIYTKGTLILSTDSKKSEFNDYCFDKKMSGKYKRIAEYYCLGSSMKIKKELCEFGCKDGACLTQLGEVMEEEMEEVVEGEEVEEIGKVGEAEEMEKESEEVEQVMEEEVKEEAGEARERVGEEKVTITGRIISGKVTADIKLEREPAVIRFFIKIFRKIKAGITGRAITTEEIPEKEIIEVTIDENGTEYDIEYITPPAQAYEENTTTGKKIIISGPDEIHYTDILAYTSLSRETPESKVKLYWIKQETINITNENNGTIEETGETKQTTEIIEIREQVNITSYDLNNNSLIDYVEWQVPELSNQTYELIIEISKAEHLDENRTFISDIYEQVKAKDDVWSEIINNNEYVRVTFTQQLDKSKDITIYARKGNITVENNSVPYDIYQKKKRIDEIRRQLGS